ncbi:Uncharacterised protein [Mycobacteroides abscessus subsp. abscessus]|nr:Uncharacterised protein [Mycobacteroides abscessus subsp. abscessus]
MSVLAIESTGVIPLPAAIRSVRMGRGAGRTNVPAAGVMLYTSPTAACL